MSTSTPGDDWRVEANRRIEKIRKGDFSLKVFGPTGEPLSGGILSLQQTRNHFLFGTAVATRWLQAENQPGERYRAWVQKHFNAIVSENSMKWYAIEQERDVTNYAKGDFVADYAARNNLALRGHCLFWSKPKFVQDWVQALDNDELRAKIDQHITETVERYQGKVICWDVNNEMLDGSFYKDRLGDEIRAWMFKRAHEFEVDSPLFVNEYHILDSDERLERYAQLITHLQGQGAPIGGIGIQEHGCERFVAVDVLEEEPQDGKPERAGTATLVPDEVWARLDRLAKFNLPIHLTEISAKSQSEERRAEGLERLFRTGFAHPSVEAILLWGFWEKSHWLAEKAALVDSNWNLLPAGERISNLLLSEWRTQVDVAIDDTGTAEFRGFFGDYDVLHTLPNGQSLDGTASFSPTTQALEVTLS